MIPTEDETWQIAADKCFLLPVGEASIVLPLSHGPRRVPKSPPCVEWQESATDSISPQTAYRGWSGLLSGVSVWAGLPGTPLGRSSGTPVPLVTPARVSVNCLVRVSSAIQISPPYIRTGGKTVIFSSLAYFHTQFCEITVFPPLLDALVGSNS